MAVVKIDNKIPLVGGKAIEATEAQITTEPIVITSNGTVNVPSGKRYAPIVTDVPQGITPSGSIEITDTNVTDVTNYATAQVVDADLVAENIKKDVNILGVVGRFEGGGGEKDLIEYIAEMVNGKGFSQIEFSNASIGTDITLNHSLGYAPTTFIMVPKSTANLATNRYYAGICTNPSDVASYTNNTALVTTEKIAIVTGGDVTAISNFENVVSKEFASLPQIKFLGLYTFITSSTASSFTIRNGNMLPSANVAGNALGTGDFVVFFR